MHDFYYSKTFKLKHSGTVAQSFDSPMLVVKKTPKNKTLTFSQAERLMHLDISLLFLSVVLFICLLIRGFICLLMIHQNGEMCQRAMQVVRLSVCNGKECNFNLGFAIDVFMAVSLIPVVHTSDAKRRGARIFMNVDIGHHAAPNITVC